MRGVTHLIAPGGTPGSARPAPHGAGASHPPRRAGRCPSPRASNTTTHRKGAHASFGGVHTPGLPVGVTLLPGGPSSRPGHAGSGAT